MASMYQTIDQLVGQIALEKGLTPDKRIILKSYMIQFLNEFRNTTQAVLRVYATANIPQSLTIPFPKDYIGWSAVGWVVDGQVKTAAQNNNIARNLTLNQQGLYTGVQQNNYTSPNGQPVPGMNTYLNNNWVLGGPARTGTVSGALIPELNGYFDEDWDNRVFRLYSVLQWPNFYLSYISDCFDPTDDYLIHPHAQNCAKAYVKWCYMRDRNDTPAWKVQEAATQVDNEMVVMKRLYLNMGAKDYLTLFDKWIGVNV